MAQFDVYPNPEPSQRGKIPFLLDLQCDLLNGLHTTVVAPLYDLEAAQRPALPGLTPIFEIEGRKVAMLTSELAGVPVKRLPPKLVNLSTHRDTIIRALDFVFTGT